MCFGCVYDRYVMSAYRRPRIPSHSQCQSAHRRQSALQSVRPIRLAVLDTVLQTKTPCLIQRSDNNPPAVSPCGFLAGFRPGRSDWVQDRVFRQTACPSVVVRSAPGRNLYVRCEFLVNSLEHGFRAISKKSSTRQRLRHLPCSCIRLIVAFKLRI